MLSRLLPVTRRVVMRLPMPISFIPTSRIFHSRGLMFLPTDRNVPGVSGYGNNEDMEEQDTNSMSTFSEFTPYPSHSEQSEGEESDISAAATSAESEDINPMQPGSTPLPAGGRKKKSIRMASSSIPSEQQSTQMNSSAGSGSSFILSDSMPEIPGMGSRAFHTRARTYVSGYGMNQESGTTDEMDSTPIKKKSKLPESDMDQQQETQAFSSFIYSDSMPDVPGSAVPEEMPAEGASLSQEWTDDSTPLQQKKKRVSGTNQDAESAKESGRSYD